MKQFSASVRGHIALAAIMAFCHTKGHSQATAGRNSQTVNQAQTSLRARLSEGSTTRRFMMVAAADNIKYTRGKETALLGLPESTSLQEINAPQVDLTGFTSHHYRQLYKGIPIERAQYVIQEKDGKVEVLSGVLITDINTTNLPALAVRPALSAGDAVRTAFRTSEEAKAELIWYNVGDSIILKQLLLAYRVNTSTQVAYIDAQSGRVLSSHSLARNIAYPYTAATVLSGSQPVTLEREAAPGSRILLRDVSRNFTVYRPLTTANIGVGSRLLFAGALMEQPSSGASLSGDDRYAYDVMYGAAKTYDFYKTKFGREGIFGNGSGVKFILAPNLTGSQILLFGSGQYNPFVLTGLADDLLQPNIGIGRWTNGKWLASPDIIGHEWTHGITKSLAGFPLTAPLEHRVLEEGVADFFGKAIEFYGRNSTLYTTGTDAGADWHLGALAGDPMRSIATPVQDHQLSTYSASYFDPANAGPGADEHDGATIISHTLYLLSQGGSNAVQGNTAGPVQGIGLDKTLRIAYNALYGLSSVSGFVDYYQHCLRSAISMYGEGSNEAKQVKNAFLATQIAPNLSAVAIFYADNPNSGPSFPMKPGKYTHAEMIAAGLPEKSVSAVKIEPGWEAVIFDNSGGGDFSGNYRRLSSNTNSMPSYNDKNMSLIIRPVGAVLYNDANYSPSGIGVRPGVYTNMAAVTVGDYYESSLGNDAVSSLRTTPGYEITLYEHDYCGGTRHVIAQNVVDLSAVSYLNDKTSSVVVRKLTLPTDVFEAFNQTGYNMAPGGSISFGLGTGSYKAEELQNAGLNGWRIGSMHIKPGFRVTLYAGDNFTGNAAVFISDIADMGLIDQVRNMDVKSVKIESDEYYAANLFKDRGYAGDYLRITDGFYNNTTTRGFPLETVTSMQVRPGYSAILSDAADFWSGNLKNISENVLALNAFTPSWDNRAQSVYLYRPVVRLYNGCYFGGTPLGLGTGRYTRANLLKLGLNPQNIGSLYLDAGYELRLYTQDNFTGDVMVSRNTGSSSINVDCVVGSWGRQALSVEVLPIGTVSSAADTQGGTQHPDAGAAALAAKDDAVLYPNPANNQVTLRYVAAAAGKLSIGIYSTQGMLVGSREVTLEKGRNEVALSTSSLQPGLYVVRLQGSIGTQALRLNIQR